MTDFGGFDGRVPGKELEIFFIYIFFHFYTASHTCLLSPLNIPFGKYAGNCNHNLASKINDDLKIQVD